MPEAGSLIVFFNPWVLYRLERARDSWTLVFLFSVSPAEFADSTIYQDELTRCLRDGWCTVWCPTFHLLLQV